MHRHPLVDLLEKACVGLIFPSETDAKVTPFLRKDSHAITTEGLLEVTGKTSETPVEIMELEDFFYAIPKERKSAFDALALVFREKLTGVKVYKIGEIRMNVYIVGYSEDGFWAGVQTEVVET